MKLALGLKRITERSWLDTATMCSSADAILKESEGIIPYGLRTVPTT